MNELQMLLSTLPEKDKIVFRASILIEPDGGVSSKLGASATAREIFSNLFDKETYTKIEKCLSNAMMEINDFIASCPQTATIINMAELQRQAGEKSS